MDAHLQQARTFFLDGVAHYEAGRLVEAERQFAAALSLAPGRPSVLTNLGAVRLKLGRAEEALALLQEALAHEPGNAEALGHCAAAHAELGQPREALRRLEQALALESAKPALWTLQGSVLRELERFDEAAAAFRRALEHGGDQELNRYYLAGLARDTAPEAAPRHYVEALFDGYADQFDSHLVQALNYQAPRLLAQRIAADGRHYAQALDLGCGTGLCGPHLRKLADRVTGVDLSAKMLEKARSLGVYTELRQEDVVAFLRQAQGPYDLVLAADLFVYLGALAEVFAQLARLVPARGTFAFTVEAAQDDEVVLRPSLRYAHSQAYVRRLARENGFAVTALEQAPVREDQRKPIAGLFVWMERVA